MGGVSRSAAVTVLHSVPLFSALDRAILGQLLARCSLRILPAGAALFAADEPADRFYVVLKGRVKVFQLSLRGDEQILHLYGRGETFGEAAMWLGQAFPAYAQTVEGSSLLVIPREIFEDLIRRRPQIALGMLAGLSQKLREFNRLIEQLSLREVPARLAAVLLQLADQAGSDTIDLPHTKRELAAHIGTIPETLSRALAKLKRSGLIAVDGARIRLLDREALQREADA